MRPLSLSGGGAGFGIRLVHTILPALADDLDLIQIAAAFQVEDNANDFALDGQAARDLRQRQNVAASGQRARGFGRQRFGPRRLRRKLWQRRREERRRRGALWS